MASADPEQRRLIARQGGYARSAKYDTGASTAQARVGFLAKFERAVDPDGLLTPAERERRAVAARKAHMLDLARKSAKARRR